MNRLIVKQAFTVKKIIKPTSAKHLQSRGTVADRMKKTEKFWQLSWIKPGTEKLFWLF